MKLSNLTAPPTQRILIYGPPKTGKSQLAGTASRTRNVTWIDMENGWSVLTKLPAEQKERINVIQLPDTRSFPIAIETCLKLIRGSSHRICDAHGKINCPICAKETTATFNTVNLGEFGSGDVVVFDSLTQLTNSAISHIIKGKPDDYRMEFEDWGNLGKLMDVFLGHVQQAGFNVVCISHETEAELEDGKVRIVPVAGTRNFSRNSAKYFDHVIYAQVVNGKHKFVSGTTGNGNISAGSRLDLDFKAGVDNLDAFFPPLTGNERQEQQESVEVTSLRIAAIEANAAVEDAVIKPPLSFAKVTSPVVAAPRAQVTPPLKVVAKVTVPVNLAAASAHRNLNVAEQTTLQTQRAGQTPEAAKGNAGLMALLNKNKVGK